MTKQAKPVFGWQPEGTEPRTGATFLKGEGGDLTTWRWLSYAPTGKYGRKGVAGRFQMKSSKGGWHNTSMWPGRWAPNSWAFVANYTVMRAFSERIANTNPFLAQMMRRA